MRTVGWSSSTHRSLTSYPSLSLSSSFLSLWSHSKHCWWPQVNNYRTLLDGWRICNMTPTHHQHCMLNWKTTETLRLPLSLGRYNIYLLLSQDNLCPPPTPCLSVWWTKYIWWTNNFSGPEEWHEHSVAVRGSILVVSFTRITWESIPLEVDWNESVVSNIIQGKYGRGVEGERGRQQLPCGG